MTSITTGNILAVILLLGLLLAIFRIIAPKIAAEPTLTPAAKAWLDLWLPLLAALPLALTLTLTHSQTPNLPIPWFSSAPTTAIAALMLGLIFLFDPAPHNPSPNHPRWGYITGFRLRHSLLLTLLGALLALASLGDRLSLPQGEACLFAAVLWLWLNSPDASESPHATTKHPNRKKPKVVLDWAGTMRQPIPILVKGSIFIGLIILAEVFHYYLSDRMELVVVFTTIFQGGVALTVWLRVGKGAAQRVVLSMLIFTVLLSTGLLAVTRLHTNLYLPFWPASWNVMGPSVLLGMSSLRATGLFILGLALVTFLHTPLDTDKSISSSKKKSQRAVLTGLLLIAGAIMIAMTGSTDFLHEVGGYVYQLITKITQTTF